MPTPIHRVRASVRRRLSLALALVAVSVVFPAAQGPKPPLKPAAVQPAVTPARSTPVHEMTAADIETFLDGMVPAQLAREDIAGVVIAVVKDSKPLFAKGYGYADVAKKIPVSPDSTLFRPGSISKLFTWTAVMQLVERGKLDLDRDVNTYLDFTIPATFPQPITLRHLMTHTPGFEEAIQELFVRDAQGLTPIGDYLKTHLPARVFPPGTTPAYSNYGTTIAGYIVQRVSGEPFDDYIERHILTPLGMAHTTFRQPLRGDLARLMSNGYRVASQPAKPFEFVEAVPAGSSSVTAADMTHFMIAHLQDGQYEGAQILRPETARLMHSPQFAPVPGMNAMALGFYEETRNGHRIIGHAGDTEAFHSDLHLIPDANVGFFISYNSAGRGQISPRTAVWQAFLNRYFPYTLPPMARLATAAADARAVSGHYLVSRRPHTTILSVMSAIGQAKVSANADGTLSIDDVKDFNGQPKKFEEVGPLMFREVGDQDRVAFKRDDVGRLVLAIDFPFMVFQKARWYESTMLHQTMIVCALVLFALTLLFWPIGGMIRRHYARPLTMEAPERRRRLAVRIVCILDLLFIVAFLVFFTFAMKNISLLSPRYNVWLRLIQIVGWLGVLGTLVVIYHAMKSWTTAGRWIWTKLADTVVALAAIAFAWFVIAWHMLHLSLRY